MMEKDAPTPNDDFPKHALRTHSSHGRARSSRASQSASTSIDPTLRELIDFIKHGHQRLDS